MNPSVSALLDGELGVTAPVIAAAFFQNSESVWTYGDHDVLFDCASLTKIMVVVPLIAHVRPLLPDGIATKLGWMVPESKAADCRIDELLAHCSGLPAHEHIQGNLFTIQPHLTKETRYSDIGYMLLGIFLERLMGASLDVLAARYIFAGMDCMYRPLGMRDDRVLIATSEHRLVGEVNDDNAWAMGGVAGHAGVFASLRGVSAWVRAVLHDELRLMPESFVPFRGGTRTLGFDTVTQPSAAGSWMPPTTVGHLGFTGVSLWMDKPSGAAAILLTNRVFYGESLDNIRRLRPLFHDALFKS